MSIFQGKCSLLRIARILIARPVFTFAEYARADKPRTLCLFFKFSEAGCRRAQQMSTGHNRGQGKAIMQKRVILPRPNGCFHTVRRFARAAQPAPVPRRAPGSDSASNAPFPEPR